MKQLEEYMRSDKDKEEILANSKNSWRSKGLGGVPCFFFEGQKVREPFGAGLFNSAYLLNAIQ